MFKKFKIQTLVIIGSLLIVVAAFAATGYKEAAPVEEAPQNNGFLSNIRELKEISDVMELIFVNFVSTKDKPVSRRTLLHGALNGMVNSLGDPHTNYFDEKTMASFKEDIKGKYAGVGMIIQKKVDDYLTVVSPIEDTPAYKAGIKPKDKIISIDGATTIGITSDDSANKLKGKPGTKVKVVVYRESLKTTKEIELIREEIKLKYVKSKMLVNKIGYVRLTEFGENVYPDVAAAVEKLQAQGMKGLILDLRSNPGGALDQAVKISSMFVKEGRVVSTKNKRNQEEVAMREGKYFGDFPLAVLINSGSASASEIVSGAIKDTKRGKLIGEKSFGKGSVQTLIPLQDGDGIKLTIAKYYTPSGICIDGIGIAPDIEVIDDEDYLLFDGLVTNVDEQAQKDSNAELIKQVKGEEMASQYKNKVDYQLDKGIEVISKELGIVYKAKIPPAPKDDKTKKTTTIKATTTIKK